MSEMQVQADSVARPSRAAVRVAVVSLVIAVAAIVVAAAAIANTRHVSQVQNGSSPSAAQQAAVDATAADLQAKIDQLSTKVATLEGTLTAQLAALNSTVGGLQQDISGPTSGVSAKLSELRRCLSNFFLDGFVKGTVTSVYSC
jgi:TolA-binding protein